MNFLLAAVGVLGVASSGPLIAATLGATHLKSAAYVLELRGREHNLLHSEGELNVLEAAYIEALEALLEEDLRSRQAVAA